MSASTAASAQRILITGAAGYLGTVLRAGLAGRAQFSGLKIKAPKKVKNGRKGAFKVTVTNKGTASSKKGKIKASGAGKGSTKLPALKPGASKTVTVKAKVTGKKGRKAVVKFKASGGASASGKAKVKVG